MHCCAMALLCRLLFPLDGDTIWCDGEKIRLMDFDTPETFRAKCEDELVAGYHAKERLIAILRTPEAALTIERHGVDKYRRSLGRLYVNGIPVSDLMIQAGLARPYKGKKREPWCKHD